MRHAAAYITFLILLLSAALPASAQEEVRMSPLYFGPNALPVPDMLDGRVSKRFYVELDYDWHAGFYGDMTHTLFAKANIPLFSPRVNLSVWMPVVEYFRTTPGWNAHAAPREPVTDGYQAGNVYVSVDFHLFRETRFIPDVSIRAAIITASGDGDEHSRNYDAPGYFFDLSAGKSIGLGGGFFQSFRLAANTGFLCWQTGRHTQNDAYMYGVMARLSTSLMDVSCAWQGYSGWMDNGDRPMVIKAGITFKAKQFRPLIAYEYGIRDYPFHHLRVGLGFEFGKAEALFRIRSGKHK